MVASRRIGGPYRHGSRCRSDEGDGGLSVRQQPEDLRRQHQRRDPAAGAAAEDRNQRRSASITSPNRQARCANVCRSIQCLVGMEYMNEQRECECGCGSPAPVAVRTRSTIFHVKGQPIRFIHGHHARRYSTEADRVTARSNVQKKSHILHRKKRLEEDNIYYAANRAIINAAKNVPCALCGNRFPSVCMDFHHRDRSAKSFGIGARAMSYGPKKIIAEIAKCDVYCANCHRIVEHGSNR